MPPGLFHHEHQHLPDLHTHGHDLTARALPPVPREASPSPAVSHGQVTDVGQVSTESMASDAAGFFSGLNGVDQEGNYYYNNVLVVAFAILLAITLGYRWWHMWKAYVRRLFTMGRDEDQRYWMDNHTSSWPRLKKHLVYAPLFGQRHNREIQLSKAVTIGTLPSRYHTILLGLYFAANAGFCFALDYTRPSYAVGAELRGRSGQLAVYNLIPTVIFPLRNNPLERWLGVSYDTFNLLHRWCARIMILESLIHTLAWAGVAISAGGHKQTELTLATSTSYQWGMVATCVFCLMFVLALSPLRHAFYETFLAGHRILAFIGLIGVWIHIEWANLPQWWYVPLMLAAWSLEYIWRIWRIMYFNYSRQHGATKVTIEALPAEACRVTFELRRPWRWQPGCHVHAYLPSVAWWSSHPFSIAWAEKRSRDLPLEVEMEEKPSHSYSDSDTSSISYDRKASLTTRGAHMAANNATETKTKPDDAKIAMPRDSDVTSLSLIMRARTGMTKQLYDKAYSAPSRKFTTWGAVEGPYGGHESMASYGTAILFAGGVGITHCVGYVHHLMNQYQAGVSATKKILLVWSVPNTEALEWVRIWMDKILKMEGRRDVLRVQLFVTKPRHRGEVVSNTGSVQMFPGRCNPQTIIQKEMQERIGAMGVTVCGPGAFSDSVRSAVRDVVEYGCVDFVEEAFTY